MTRVLRSASGSSRKRPLHLLGRLQGEFVVGPALPMRLLQGLAVLDGHQAVLEEGPLGHMVVGVVGSDDGDVQRTAQIGEPPDALRVAADEVALELQVDVALSEPVQVLLGQSGCLISSALGEQPGEVAPWRSQRGR